MSLESVVGTLVGTAAGSAANTANPASLGLEAFIAFNNYLCTAQGQVFAGRSQAIIDNIFAALHIHIAADEPVVSPLKVPVGIMPVPLGSGSTGAAPVLGMTK